MGSKEGFIFIYNGDFLTITDRSTGAAVQLPTRTERPDMSSVTVNNISYINHHARRLGDLLRDQTQPSIVPFVELDADQIEANIRNCIYGLNLYRERSGLVLLDFLPVVHKKVERLLSPSRSAEMAMAANSILVPFAEVLTGREVDIDIMAILGSIAGGIIDYRLNRHDVDMRIMIPNTEALEKITASLTNTSTIREIQSHISGDAIRMIEHIDIMTIVTGERSRGDAIRITF